MISVSIDRTSLSKTALTISDTSAPTTAGLYLADFDTGQTSVENSIAQSRHHDGGYLTATRRTMATLQLVIRVQGSSVADLQTRIADLAEALDQFGYTVTITEGTSSTAYQCLPGSWSRAYNKVMMLHNADMVTASITRQPLSFGSGS